VNNFLKEILELETLRKRVVFTLIVFAIYRLGSHIPIPGVDPVALSDFMSNLKGSLFSLYDIFSGGNLSRMTLFALGVMPYISASIVMQLLSSAIPELQRLAKEEGDYGRQKINEYTKYITVFVAGFQSLGIATWLEHQTSPHGYPVVPHGGILFVVLAVLGMVASTMILVWLGDMITEKGIGNGMSMLIFAGIVANFPEATIRFVSMLRHGDISPFAFVGAILIIIAVIAAIVIFQEAERRIPIQYPRRQVGRQEFVGGATYLPIKLNPAGVIPIIFAQSLLIVPSTILGFIKNPIAQSIHDAFNPLSLPYNFAYVVLIIFFTYFYTAVLINPYDVAENLKKANGFIPGVRPGQQTVKFFESVINRLIIIGAVFLSVVAIVPLFLTVWLKVPFYFGGTTALIVVGVALDTLNQIDAQIITKKYKAYTRKK
jgi:preprotein translocase subunit SecY